MKILLILPLFLLSMLSFAQSDKIQKIEFNSMTRGYTENISITADSILVKKGGNRKEDQTAVVRTIKVKEWQSLLKNVQPVNLAKISTLESPTNKRAYDGARHSKISVITRDGIYEHLFDDENPNTELQKLMDCILKLRGK